MGVRAVWVSPVLCSSLPRLSEQKQYEDTSGKNFLKLLNVSKASGKLKQHTNTGEPSSESKQNRSCVLPVVRVQQVHLCAVRHVDEFTLNREEAAIFLTLRKRRRICRVESSSQTQVTAAQTCRSKVRTGEEDELLQEIFTQTVK